MSAILIGETRIKTGVLMFAIMAFVSLLFTVVRLVFMILLTQKKNNIYKEKKDSRKTIALALSICLIVMMFRLVGSACGTKNTYFYSLVYNVTEDEYYAVVSTYCGDKKELEIPYIHYVQGEGAQVIAIGENAFEGNRNITSVDMPYEIIEIRSGAFRNCTSLESVTLGDGVTTIEDVAFEECKALESIFIPESVTSIGERAFFGCTSLESIFIPSSVTCIEWGAFYGCDSLTIYCEAEEQPENWESDWCGNATVVWGHTHSYTNGECVCGAKEN